MCASAYRSHSLHFILADVKIETEKGKKTKQSKLYGSICFHPFHSKQKHSFTYDRNYKIMAAN